jgi:hypothetical protein
MYTGASAHIGTPMYTGASARIGSDTPDAANIDDFPYTDKFVSLDELRARVKNLQNYQPRLVKMPYRIINMPDLQEIELFYLPVGSPYVLVGRVDDYDKYTNISPYFTDKCRVLAKRYDNADSVHTFWQKNRQRVIAHSHQRFGNVGESSSTDGVTMYKNLRESLYELFYEVGIFRPTNLVAIIKLYGAKRILDFSAGWGDRLIAAMAMNVDYYCGVDPNGCLHPHYADIIEFMRSCGSNTNAIMIESPFETAPLNMNDSIQFDLIFTSPPYFDLEIYSDAADQSHHYGNLDAWYEKFLLFSIKKAWAQLQVGGHLVMVINDMKTTKYTARMIRDINKFNDSLYLGVISYADMIGNDNVKDVDLKIKSPQPMWIWQKIIIDADPAIHVRDVTFNRINNINTDTDISIDISKENISVSVIADDMLPGGTKQRGWRFLQDIRESEIVYAGPYNGAAQVALAVGAKLSGKTFTVFLQRSSTRNSNHDRDIKSIHPLTIRARMYGANIVFKEAGLQDLQKLAENYVRSGTSRRLLAFGLDEPAFIDALTAQLSSKLLEKLSGTVGDIWLVGGSATLVKILYKIYPDRKFHLVQVGKTIWPDQINANTQLYVAPEKFYEPAAIMPPYNTIATYDAKLWRFVLEGAKSGDIVWNVAGERMVN